MKVVQWAANNRTYLRRYCKAVVDINPIVLADSIYQQLVDSGDFQTIDKDLVRSAVFHAYSAIIAGAVLAADNP